MNVLLEEVGLRGGSGFQRVGEPTRTSTLNRYGPDYPPYPLTPLFRNFPSPGFPK